MLRFSTCFLDGGLHGVFITGIGVDHIPLRVFSHDVATLLSADRRGEQERRSRRRPMPSKIQMKMPTTMTQTMTMPVLFMDLLGVGHRDLLQLALHAPGTTGRCACEQRRAFFPCRLWLVPFPCRPLPAWRRPEPLRRLLHLFVFRHSVPPFFPFSQSGDIITSSHCGRCAFCRRGSTCSAPDGRGYSSCSSWCCSFSACTQSICRVIFTRAPAFAICGTSFTMFGPGKNKTPEIGLSPVHRRFRSRRIPLAPF